MLKTRKKWISLLVVLTFLLSLLPAGMAGAASMYSCPNPQTVADDTKEAMLGAVFVEVPAGVLLGPDAGNPRDILEIELGSDFDISDKGTAGYSDDIAVVSANDTSKSICVVVPATVGDSNNALATTDVDATIDNSNKVTVKVKSITNANNTAFIRIYLNKVDIADGASGDITATITGFGGFVDGSVVIGRVQAGAATISIRDVANLSGDGNLEDITILENVAGALKQDPESVKLILPSGFEWNGTPTINLSGGFKTGDVTASLSGTDTLVLNVVNKSTGTKGKIVIQAPAVKVDESKAAYGDVKLRVRGESEVKPTELIVAKYAELGQKIEVKGDVPTVVAGKYQQEIADLVVKENARGSLVLDRTITLKLPANAKWVKAPYEASDSGAKLQCQGFVGTDGRTLKYKVVGTSSDAAEIELEGFEVALEPGVSGDLKVTVGGTAGLSGELVVAKVVDVVTATVDTKATVKIGVQDQLIGTIKIQEAKDGAIQGDRDLIVALPEGVKFAATPKVEVTEGDLDIDESGVKRQNNDTELLIPIDKASNDASTITISNVKLTVDRTVAEGDIIAKIKGDAVVQVNDLVAIKDDFDDDTKTAGEASFDIDVDGQGHYYSLDAKDEGAGCEDTPEEGFFPVSTTAAKLAIATCVTPAPGETKGVAVFKINDAKYVLNGQEVTMDVAPYIKDGRTFLPVRFAANAVGVSDANIIWDGVARKVTVIKGDRVVQMTIGSKVLLLNGAAITMDVAPEITAGRTMLPIRFLAQALGADIQWNAETQEVTVNF